ncbi:hypothetical protein J2S43_004398 [Catenuloplanes nepalensis]|uniref:Peptidase M50 n=1 Tax=Catenuloplanes nepalensis TaxID=587533 RepID=A0ABT9MXA4_9ACTN|nr:hypothetical protein [Catenuloplanes nepalensis]MDP9795886.1 hypothetical protein [Catenuloplanes nepalensis]
MLFALATPVAFAGFALSFLLAVVVRAMAIRLAIRATGLEQRRTRIMFDPRHDFDVFGVVACLIGGMGWGRGIEVDDLPSYRGRGRKAIVYAAGPLSVLVLSQLVLLGFALGFPDYRSLLSAVGPLNVKFGLPVSLGTDPAGIGAEITAAVGIGLFTFALFDLIPLPPLDGWGLLWCSLKRPGTSAQTARLWLVEKNIGVVLLFLLQIFPFGGLGWVLLNPIGAPLLRVWAW